MIHLVNVHLKYSLLGCRDTSLKSYVFKLVKGKKEKAEEFHALKGISFTVNSGERVGILGHNGAGKTTLLRAIAGLYPISEGNCHVQGEIRSLFELSLGFESEATGKENILYRGLLLGQTPSSMRVLQNEIIQFADIGNYIDYPIKTYSAGMLVRLAFAISTYISGDILLIDEVIGAGDASFMQKASAKMRELISQAKILLLVSHDISALRIFCNRLLLLQEGALIFDGDVEKGISYYLELIAERKKMTTLNTKQNHKTSLLSTFKCRVKKIGVFLPIPYRGGTLKGAKNIAKMICLGSRMHDERVEVVFSCCEGHYSINDEFSDLIDLGIEIRETNWKPISKKALEFIGNFKPVPADLMHSEYIIPTDGINNFFDCDFWLLISDRTSLPLAPVIPYGAVVYDYIQRYVPELMGNKLEESYLKTVRNASVVITTTPHTRNDAIQYAGVNADKLWLFPREFYPPCMPLTGSSLHKREYFIWITNLTVHKNHIRAIKALEIFYMEEKGVLDVLILGPGMETLRNGSVNHPLIHIREMIQRIQENALLKQRCHIIGEVSDVKYSQYLAHAQFLWHPVLIDDGTFCAIEAAYLNIPCLSSDYPAMRFMNERFSLNLLFADPYDIKDMAKKLKRIENEAIERKTLLPSQIHLEQFSPDHLALEFWTNLKKWLP